MKRGNASIISRYLFVNKAKGSPIDCTPRLMDLPAVRSRQSLYHNTNKLIYETNIYFLLLFYVYAPQCNQQSNFENANVIKSI